MKKSLSTGFKDYVILFFRYTKATFQLMYGMWKVMRLPEPRVTIFGGSRIKHDSPYALLAHRLAHRLLEENISVITGGGPGIMAAASCTFVEPTNSKYTAKTLGISVRGLEAELKQGPECEYDRIVMDYFFTRKWLMIHHSTAFAVFPGGFGTLEELAEILTLMQTKMLAGVPIVLVGKDYWDPFIHWIRESCVGQGLVSKEDLALMRVTDDIEYALSILKERCGAS